MLDRWTEIVRAWAGKRPDVIGVLLVGSHARGAARPASDIDFILLVADTQPYLSDRGWARAFGTVEREILENWGKVRSLRVWYEGDAEVEWGLTTLDWIGAPLDSGTRGVLIGGYRVVYDRDRELESRLISLDLDDT